MFIILCDVYFSASVPSENMYFLLFQVLYPTLEDKQRTNRFGAISIRAILPYLYIYPI